MSSTRSTPAPARLAATILILREGAAGLEVLMVARHHEIDSFSGALVFPGGKLAPGDTDPRVRERCTGIADLSEEQIALRVSAIREAFEESGILLARHRESGATVDAACATQLSARYRQRLDSGAIGIADMLEAEDLVLACDELVAFAHWITPVTVPKRFDTHFYLTATPAEQIAVHDGKEMVDSQWIRPVDALADQAAGKRTIVAATVFNLRKLTGYRTIAEAFAAARSQSIVTVLPEIIERPEGRFVRIPEAAGYGVTEYPASVSSAGRSRD